MSPDEPISLSALQHYVYCPRQCALIHMEQSFDENLHTQRGQAVHARVNQAESDWGTNCRIERALPLYDDEHGLIGIGDVVEFKADGTPYPVEYKHGPRRGRAADDMQLAAQALCLEAMTGMDVPEGAIYHASSHRRRVVPITPQLKALVLETAVAVRIMLSGSRLPPAIHDKRCIECSLRERCGETLLAADARLRAELSQLYRLDKDDDDDSA